MRLYRLGKTWYLDYQQDGRRVRKSLKTTKRQIATRMAREIERDLTLGQLPTSRGKLTLDCYIEEIHLAWGKIHQKPSTFQEGRYTLRKFAGFTPPGASRPLGEFPLNAITREHIEAYKVERLDQVARPTVNSDLQVIRALFNRAVEWEYLQRSPYRAIRMFRVDRQPRTRFLVEAEVESLLRAARELQAAHGRYADLHPLIATAVFGGLRKAELGWLCWEDIDFERDTITVQGRRQADGLEVTTKNYQTRTIPLHPRLREVLLACRRPSGYCFKPDIQKPVRRYRYDFSIALAAAAKAAGIEGVTAHVLRHTFGSHLVMAGVDLPTVKELMGHADISTTMIYAHLAQDHKARAIRKLFAEEEAPQRDAP